MGIGIMASAVHIAGGLVPLYTDDFNRADGVPGANWTQLGVLDSYRIVSNKLVDVNMLTQWIEWVAALGGNDHWVQADITDANANYVVVHARSTSGGDTCYMAFLTPGGGCEIGKNTGGFSYGTVVNKAFTHGDAHRLRLEVQGSQQRFYVDNVLELTGTDTTITTGTHVGLNTNSPVATYDNFAAGNL